MLILRNIIITILLLILAAISVVGIMVEAPQVLNWTPDRINAIGRSVLTIMRPSLLLFLVWWLILLSTLLVLFLTVVRPRRRMKIEVQMGGGRVVIMDAAIKKYIRNALSELGEVTVRKIDLREHRNLVVTNITADVRTKENLPTLERRIIGRVRAALAEDLGITNLGDVHVLVRNFEVSSRDGSGGSTPVPADKSKSVRESDETPQKLESHEKTVPLTNDSSVKESPSPFPLAAPLADPVVISEEVAQPITLTETDSPKSRFGNLRGNASAFDATSTGSDKPETIETSDSEPISFGDQVLQDQEKKPDGATDHTDLDEPLPWGKPYSDTKEDDEQKDEDKKDFRPL